MGSIVAAATKQLQKRYISRRFSSSVDEWPPYQPKHYTTLAFIHNKGKFTDAVRFSVAQELAVAGKIHTAPYKHSNFDVSITKSISDIFLPIKAPDGSFIDLHILIEGAPGIGKTVLAKEIAYQWAKNELLTSKNLLLLVFLRECSQTQLSSFEGLMQYLFRYDEMASQLTSYLSKVEGEGMVIIFDGFDELSEENRNKSIVVDIINRRILAKSCLVITSRPTASLNLHVTVDRRVEIVGFTEEDRLNYIQTALEGKNEQIKALQHYLQSNPTINALCYIPLNMTILLCLAEDGIDTLPKTQTEMYEKFIKMTIVRFFKRYEKHTTVISITELPHPHNKLYVELAKLAYEALNSDKIVFTLLEIKEACSHLTMTTSNWSGLGLLKAVQYFSVEKCDDQVTLHFLHFSIQEYMAAWYISTLPQGKQVELLKKTFWNHHYYNTWIMYVGITSGSSFALRHFLSGNRFKIYSKIFKKSISKVSERYLEDKLKCLHLFQCLVEANKEHIIASVKQLFQNKQIDLSNQTLLPSDLNTLGFFLIRSINKEWDELDLSNCNIGNKGSKILCDRFLDKDVRNIVTIKMVNFSYNQLNVSSLKRLFGLFNSWHTSEIIIADEAILNNATDDKAIEEMILQSSTLTLVLIGLYFFSKNSQPSKVLHVLSNTTSIRIIYLLNCSWKFDSTTSELLALLEKQKLNKVRIFGSSLDELFIKTMALYLLHNNDCVNMLVYDPTMSDEIADNISSVISSSSKDISGVMLIVSSSKVQGIVNTSTLSNELSAVELFNLNRYVRYFNTKVCPWSESKNFNKDNIVGTFVKLLYITKSDWQLQIAMTERDILIAHKAKLDNIRKQYNNNISVVYFSSCDVNKLDYDIVNKSCSILHSLNSPGCVELLYNKLLHKQSVPTELFIYGNIEDSLMNSLIKLIALHHHHNLNNSAVVVTNDVIIGHNPNIQQIALAFQLQPSTTKWVLCSPVSAIAFHQTVNALLTLHTHWIELNFTCCNIGDVECEIMHRTLKLMKHSSTVKKLSIPFNKLTVSGIYDLVRIIVIWGVQELTINGTNDVLYDCLINDLISGSKNSNKYFLSITYCNKLICFVCNARWNNIVTKMNHRLTQLYIANCDLALLNSIEIINLSNSLSRLCVINGTVYETIVIEILKLFSNKLVEVSFSNVRITDNDNKIWNILTSKEYGRDIKLNLLLSTDQWLCVCNPTNHQLHFICHYFINQSQPHCYGMHLIRRLEQIDGNRICIFENDRVNVIRLGAKAHQKMGITQVIAALRHITSLNTIDIDNYSITSVAADHLENVIHNNTKLQEIRLNGNNLQKASTVKIIKSIETVSYNSIISDDTTNSTAAISAVTSESSLKITGSFITTRAVGLHIATLRKFCISNNNITDDATDDIAAVISCNIHLQELNLDSTNLQTSGAIKITRGLQKISSLTKLCFHGNLITDGAADDIAAAISCNTHLQELNLGNNDFTPPGALKIVRSLQKILTLTKLCFHGNCIIDNNNIMCSRDKSISNEAIDNLATAISSNTNLQELNLGSTGLRALDTIKITRGLEKISSLYINDNNITHEAVDDLAAAISHNTKLKEFDISGNNLQPIDVMKILKALKHTSTLRKLYISNNDITDEVVDDIATVISNTQIEVLDISGNNLQAPGAMRIAKYLEHICTPKTLFVGGNEVDKIAASVYGNSCLQELYVFRTDFQTTGAKANIKTLQGICTLTKILFANNNVSDEAVNDIATIVSNNTKLKVIEISGSKLQTSGTIKIMKALENNYTLKRLYLNDNNITEEAANDIVSAVSFCVDLQELNLGSNNLQTSGIIRIARTLQNNSSLIKLYINDNNITDEAADDIAAAISCNIHLQELNLGSNNLQTSGAIKITRGLQKISSLTKLCFHGNLITDGAADDIAAAISCNIHLQELNLGNNDFTPPGALKIVRSLQKILTLTKLCFHGNCIIDNNNIMCSRDKSISNEAIDNLATAISSNTNLQELNLGSTGLRALDTIKITRGLEKISSLYINDNNITHEAVDDLAAAISHNTKLKEFDISGNNLQPIDVMKILKALKHTSTLRKLYISNNDITDEVVDDIATVISNTQIEVLDISGNNLQAPGAMRIAKYLEHICTPKTLFVGGNEVDKIAASVSSNSCLQELYVFRTDFQTTGAKANIKTLQGICTLTKILFANNNISDEAVNDIATIVSNNTKLKVIEISGSKLQTSGTIKIMKALENNYTLKRLYLNDNNITEEAANDIVSAVSFCVDLQELNLGSNNLLTSGIIRIARALQNNSSLTKLYIHNNNITYEAADDIAAAISCNIHLQELNLGSNNLQTSGIIKIARTLQNNSSLIKLYINDNNITDEAADDIAAAISCNIHLQELNLGSNNLQTSGIIKIARTLQSNSSLIKLYINDNNITDEAADDIAAAISCNIHLQELNLGSNNLQTSGIIRIARTLQNNLSLTKLYIHNNNITDEAADDIAAAISCNIHLQELNLGSNNLQTSGIIRIARTLQNNSSLIKLYINDNNITDRAADDIAAAISCNIHLQELNLGSNNLQTSGAIKITRGLQKISSLTKLCFHGNLITDGAADDIAAAISCNIHLQELNLGNNDFTPPGALKIVRSLQKILTLTKLCFHGNCIIDNNNIMCSRDKSISNEAIDNLATAISSNTNLQELNLGSTGLRALDTIKITRGLEKISSLYINDNNITHEAVDDLAAAISHNTKLKEFDISGNNLQPIDVMKILKALKHTSTLRKLYISNNDITDEVVDDIATVISNTQIEVLDISGNNLQAPGAMRIAKYLEHICTPKTLFVGGNEADKVAASVYGNSCLQELYVFRTDFQTTGAKANIKTLQGICTLTKILFANNNNISDEAVNDIATIVSNNTKLKVIEISGSKLQTSGTIKIMKALEKNYTLKRLYLNDNNITEEAANDIVSAVSFCVDLQELNLGSNNLQTSGIIRIARTLQNNSSLTKLYIHNNNITDEAADDIAAVISCNIHLQELNLGSNNLQTSGTKKIAKALQKLSSLIKLYINDNNITDEAADDIAAAISCNIHLQELNLGSNNLQTSGIIRIARTLQNNSSLTKLYIHNNNITDEAAGDIAVAIFFNIHLQELNLGSNNLQTSGTKKITKALQKLSSLIKLYINDNNITDKAADDIAAAISHETEELDVSGNNLKTVGVIKIAQSMQRICTLKKLCISNNNITNEAADTIAAIFSCNVHLRELNIASNYFTATGAIKITRGLQKVSTLTKLCFFGNSINDSAADDIAIAISCNVYLQELNLGNNKFTPPGALKIAKSLLKIVTLTKLCFHGNWISDNKNILHDKSITNEAIDDIATAISCNTDLQELNLGSTGLQTLDTIKIARGLQKISSLTRLYINNNNITHEAAGDIATAISCSINLQVLNLGSNNLQASGTIKIAKALQKLSSLIKLYINDNNMTDEAADDIATAISCNIYLQELNLGSNDLQTSGTMKIAKALQKISTLTKLYIDCNNITDKAADDIGLALTCNGNLQLVNISKNDFSKKTSTKISTFASHLTIGINLFIS